MLWLIRNFTQLIKEGEIEIYNEFSLQHELGIFLRGRLPNKIQFERNVSYFGIRKSETIKREIDISVFSEDGQSPDAAIELKYPRNGQHPEQLFNCCKDIKLLEQLKSFGFNKGYFIFVAEDPLFYSGKAQGIYTSFRSNQTLTGTIHKPTGKKDQSFELNGRYDIDWKVLYGNLRYTVVEVQSIIAC